MFSIDINECVEQSPCDQQCTNTIGSFTCSCNNGYELDSDQTTCRGIYIANIMYIKQMKLFFLL